MLPYLMVGLGGAIGSIARYATGVFIGRMWEPSFPYATLAVNIVGSLAMGLFIGFLARTTPHWQADARLFVAVGVLGGFTTFSSFSLDTISLIERGEVWLAILYVGLSIMIGLVALFGGLVVMRGMS